MDFLEKDHEEFEIVSKHQAGICRSDKQQYRKSSRA